MTVMQKKTRFLRYSAVSANLGLLVWVAFWQASLSPHRTSTTW